MQSLSVRTNGFKASMIRAMTYSKKAEINLGQGFPDFDPPEQLLAALAAATEKGPHQYALTSGALNFRDALAKKQSGFMRHPVSAEAEILTTCGATEAMIVALLTIIDPGDKVIVFSPYYENYVSQAKLSGAEIEYVNFKLPELTFDPDELEHAFQENPKAIIVCNPSNPTGKVFSRDELLLIADLAEKYDTYVITDEVYEHIVYDGLQHTYFATLPGMWERTITCGSLSKTFAITGWRLGYLIAAEKILQPAKRIHDFLTVCAPAPLQEAVIVGLEMGPEYYAALQRTYQRKRDLFIGGLRQLGLSFIEPQGAYYVLVDIPRLFSGSDIEFCSRLLEETGVISVPGSSFQRGESTGTIRFHFAKKESTLENALNRLEQIKNITSK